MTAPAAPPFGPPSPAAGDRATTASAATAAPRPGESTPPPPAPLPPAVLPALALFERGDFRGARLALEHLTRAPVGTAPAPDIVAATASLRGRLDIDPVAFVVGGVALGILVLVATTYL
jgi:hypothetical protein